MTRDEVHVSDPCDPLHALHGPVVRLERAHESGRGDLFGDLLPGGVVELERVFDGPLRHVLGLEPLVGVERGERAHCACEVGNHAVNV